MRRMNQSWRHVVVVVIVIVDNDVVGDGRRRSEGKRTGGYGTCCADVRRANGDFMAGKSGTFHRMEMAAALATLDCVAAPINDAADVATWVMLRLGSRLRLCA